MKFTMYPGVWDNVVAEVEEAGHEFVSDLHQAEFLIYAGGRLPDPLPENIGFVQFVFSGIDRLVDAGVIQPGTRWANAAGAYGRPVAEIAMTLLLAQLHQVKAAGMAASFQARGPIDAAQGWLFDGPTVAIVGAGGIADGLIPMLRPFGVRIIAVNRSGRAVEGADETVAMADAEWVWSEADAFVLAMPLTEQTRGVVDAERFAQMKESAVVVNVGRGELIVTDDLVEALRTGQIAGAAMDVTDPEPLPDGHPLWRLPTCTITPHIAATGRIASRLITPTILANAAAFEAGERMPTEVHLRKGY
ncbi:D-isomer specific 2-hydroxyacid dehydrogenase family protein [Corynebacterium suedekumii]|uniref:D-isomer specific 2-hydroxyacid dehydrogenase family protein n=1 Tax=Corynebacterium suedekumii TaxID=3049801 RepID=A0ABY8VMW6_9CORY|nr:D-isomer specific 2-hydroxyacid dehydrogenase family protein [Corynebacterium suedekumii]WIM70326.1 D-isomer specific 2-hydroxyacid dehydrogenase family protein [Corynebacterium suedekumii]